MIWVAPGVVFAVLAVPVVLALRRCAVEASELRGSLAALAELAPAVRELQADVASLRQGVPPLRRPALPSGS